MQCLYMYIRKSKKNEEKNKKTPQSVTSQMIESQSYMGTSHEAGTSRSRPLQIHQEEIYEMDEIN